MTSNSVRFLIGLLAPIVFVIAFVIFGSALILSIPDSVPAPALSNSLSFNEKARWIRTYASPERCKILVLGSSMALNNIDHEVLAKRFGSVDIINAASWDLSISETERMLEVLVNRCRPRLIIWAVYHGDLSDHSDVKIQWDQFSSYLSGRSLLLNYFAAPDLPYYVRTWWKGDEALRYGRATYFSLDFDAQGGVNFDCDHFRFDPERWMGFLGSNGRIKPLSVDFDAVKLTLIKAARIPAFQQAKIVFFTPPLRGIAEQEFHSDELDRIWESFSHLAASFSAQYIRIRNSGKYPDSLFADYAHLNACGAKKVTEELATRIAAIGGFDLSLSSSK